MGETRERKVVDRRVAIALGIICIVLASCLVSTIVVLFSLNSQISSLKSEVSSLKSELDAIPTPTSVSELVNDTSAWVDRTVVLNGTLDGPIILPGDVDPPCDYELESDNQTIGVSFSASVNLTGFYSNQYINSATNNGTIRVYFLNSSITVRICGVVIKGETRYGWGLPPTVTYYVEAEEVEMA